MDKNNTPRLMSLDALRGFDMFWIIGGGAFFIYLAKSTNSSTLDWWATQMHHVPWDGFHAFDLIFPLFMFISGVAIPYSINNKLENGVAKSAIYKKVIRRALILVFLGLVYNGFLNFNFDKLRVASVLGQIGIAYLIAAIVMINTNNLKQRIYFVFTLFLIYSVIQLWVPIPKFGAGNLTPEGSINGFIDQLFLPGRLYRTTFDPEGILCIISASGITMLGALTGYILRSNKFAPSKKSLIIFISGVVFILLAQILKQWYPIIKSAWTTTFNFMAGGISLVLLSVFYQVIDVWKFRRWTFIFRVIGFNSITIYMAVRIINFKSISVFFFSGISELWGDFANVIIVVGMLILEWLFLYFLYKKKIFLKV